MIMIMIINIVIVHLFLNCFYSYLFTVYKFLVNLSVSALGIVLNETKEEITDFSGTKNRNS